MEQVTFEISPTLAHYMRFSGGEFVEPGFYCVLDGIPMGPFSTMQQAIAAYLKNVAVAA